MKKCLHCSKEIPITNRESRRKIFCNRSCSAIYNNMKREGLSENQKLKISNSLKEFYRENPKKINTEKWSKKIGLATKGKYKGKYANSILELSKRTVSKIFKRLKIGCSICGWDKATCDIHHILGRKIENPDSHTNLTYVCPNCHRLFRAKKLKPENAVNLVDQIGERWRDYYFG